tara:strand:- start:4803 stop:7502 length:2700 start_codon:yes stop_codon:yes gene_type:complete
MPKKALASLNVVINAVTAPLFRGLARAGKRIAAFGARMKAVGRSISMSFSLPFAAVGVAGAKMAIDFEKSMTKINTLVGISGKEVGEFSKEIMALSGKVAQAPADLAEGLFFLTSAGLRGANAMETLEQVSKGVAMGLGEQADLAKVAAAAQNAYGVDVVSASDALDMFGMAVRTGMFESQELAEALGTQVGMAAELGISFEEVVANISTYTRTTGDARSATTGFGGVMMAFAKETGQGEKALEKVNMSYEGLRKMIQDKGLQETLFTMKDAFAENKVEMTEFFGKSQAVKNIMGVLGNQSGEYVKILDEMGGATGMVSDGFDTVAGTTGFQMQQTFQEMKLAVQELGVMLMPLFTSIVKGASKLVKTFTEMSSGGKTLAVAGAALVAFSGPLMTIIAGLFSWGGLVVVVLVALASMIGTLALAFSMLWPTIEQTLLGAINYFIGLYNRTEEFRGIMALVLLYFAMWGNAFKALWSIAGEVFRNIGILATTIFGTIGKVLEKFLKKDFKGMAKAAGKGFKNIGKQYADMGKFLGKETKQFAKNMKKDFQDELSKVKPASHIEPLKEGDIVKGIKGMGLKAGQLYMDGIKSTPMWKTYGEGLFNGIKGFIGGIDFGGIIGPTGGILGGPSGEDTKEDPIINEEGTADLETEIQKRKSLIQQYLDWAEDGYDEWAGNIGKAWAEISKHINSVLNGISGIMSANHEKAMTELNNENKKNQEVFDEDFEREQLKIENSGMGQEKKDEMMLALKDKFEKRQEAMDKKADEKKKALMKKQAQRDKNMKIAQAIMATAQAVVQALTAGPILGPIMAVIVGALGAAQIAAIASTPIPLAKGGLAFGPTNAIVGDNVGAAHDPEVIAPLSKLKGMLGSDMALDVSGVVKGNDIFLSNRNTDEQRERYI